MNTKGLKCMKWKTKAPCTSVSPKGFYKGTSMLLKRSCHLQFAWLNAFLSWVCPAECLAEAVLSKICFFIGATYRILALGGCSGFSQARIACRQATVLCLDYKAGGW